MEGYKEAEQIDKIINGILETEPITKDNIREWENFNRTIKTTINLVQRIINDMKL